MHMTLFFFSKVRCIYQSFCTYWRRLCTTGTANPILDDIDEITRDGLSNILNLPFSDDNSYWRQANLPVKDGGLGVRSVASLASSAFLASAASTNELQPSILVRTHIVEDQSKASALEQWLDANKSVEPIEDAIHIQKNLEKPGIEET